MVNRQGTARYIFASSYTSLGFYTFVPQLIAGMEKVFILKGPPGSGKSTFIRMVGDSLLSQGWDVEFWVSSLDPIVPDGVAIPQLGAAVVNGSLPHLIDPLYGGSRQTIIKLSECWDQNIVDQTSQDIIASMDEIDQATERAVTLLGEASWNKQVIRQGNATHLNLDKINQLIDRLADGLMSIPSGEKHYFAGSLTEEGLRDYVQELSKGCRCRYIFTGPPGSGKSTVISGLVTEARRRGYHIEYFHCGLEVDFLVMVIIKNLQLALIEAGHSRVISRPGDVVIDMTKYLESQWAESELLENAAVQRRLESLLGEAQQEISKVNQALRKVKKVYTRAMDFERLDQKRQEVVESIISNEK